MDPIVRRILGDLGTPALVEGLAALPGSDLQSLLLAVMRARAARATAPALLSQSATPLLRPSAVDARHFAALDHVAFAAAAGFEAIDLAPVAPFAVDAVLGAISPNNVLAALRGTQVLADPTSALALECARRRRHDRSTPVRLCASHRLIRLQPFTDPSFTPHFRLFAMVSSGRDRGSFDLEITELRDQLAVYLRLLRGLTAIGYRFDAIDVAVSDTDVVRGLCRAQGADPDEVTRAVHATDADGGVAAIATRGLVLPTSIADPAVDLAALDDAAGRAGRRRLARAGAEVIAPLAAEFPEARFRLDGSRVAGLGYYAGLCLLIRLTVPGGGPAIPAADGGFTTWTQALLGDGKERLLISGIGSELLCKRYRRPENVEGAPAGAPSRTSEPGSDA